jgi:hypothetical protein
MEATLRLVRAQFGPKSTIGSLSWRVGNAVIDECVTLEDEVRAPGVKVPGATAIPAGRYRVVVNDSQRFGRPMPRLLDVPNFDGILMHAGNSDLNTDGCILLGTAADNVDWISDSRDAFERFFARITWAIAVGYEVWIEISGAPQAAAA